MKYLFSCVFLLYLAPAMALDAYFKTAEFLHPKEGPFVETYMRFNAGSLQYRPTDNGLFQAEVELTYVFTQKGEVKEFSKLAVKSPVIFDTTNALIDFVDQQRFVLPQGEYQLSIRMVDVNRSKDTVRSAQTLVVGSTAIAPAISDMLLIEKFQQNSDAALSKSGLLMTPYVSGFFPKEVNKLMLYAEIYGMDSILKSDKLLITADIEDVQAETVLPEFHQKEVKPADKVIPVLKQWDITELPTGNFMVVLKAINRDNEVVAERSLLIQRASGHRDLINQMDSATLAQTFVSRIEDMDSLRNLTWCLRAESDLGEEAFIDNFVDTANRVSLERFFYGYWYERNPADPESAWMRYYKDRVQPVVSEFSTRYQHGCKTDRGRILLTYGRPNTRVERPNDPSYYPYEIWHYYKVRRRAEAKFVFYDPTLSTGNYRLLHSNVLGELFDYNWEITLRERTGRPASLDEAPDFETYGIQPGELYADPR